MISHNLNFHLTFPPTPEFITRLLEVCNDQTPRTKEELSELTGIPTGKSSGKVDPHICYAEYMGLLKDDRNEGKHLLQLTTLGKEILKQDPGMQEKVSLAICHAHITSRYGGAPLWSAMFKVILPKYPSGINDSILNDELEKTFDGRVKTGPFYSSYFGMFSNLNLLKKENGLSYINKCNIFSDLIYVYAYTLLYEWEKAYGNQVEITASELSSLRIAETFGLSGILFYNMIENLAEKNIVRFNRQLAPYTLLKLCSAEEIIPLLFDELC